MEVIVHSLIWSVDTEILSNGNPANALRGFSIRDRLAMLGRVAQEAYDIGTSRWRSEPLGERTKLMFLLFTAPEYLFALSDRQHLIDEEAKQEVVRTLAAISRRMPMMIMVPGTIAWKKPLVRTGAKRFHGGDPKDPKTIPRIAKFRHRLELDEGALLRQVPDYVERTIRDAPSENARKFYEETRETVAKNRVEGIQYDTKRLWAQINKNLKSAPERCFLARNTAYAFYGGEEVGRYHKRGNFKEVYPSESDEGHVLFMPGGTGPGKGERFTVAGIKFAIEICVDHEVGYLTETRFAVPHLQVVLSAKVRLDPTHTIIGPGGYVVHACSDIAESGVMGRPDAKEPAKRIPSEILDSGHLGKLRYNRLVINT